MYCLKNNLKSNGVITISVNKQQHNVANTPEAPLSLHGHNPFFLRGNDHSDFCGNDFIAFLFIVLSLGNASWTIWHCLLLNVVRMGSHSTHSFVFGFLHLPLCLWNSWCFTQLQFRVAVVCSFLLLYRYHNSLKYCNANGHLGCFHSLFLWTILPRTFL